MATAGAKVWTEIAPTGGDFQIDNGQRYAALASASRNYALVEIAAYLGAHGWQVTYSWEQGAATRELYAVDTWLAGLAPDPTENHRWVWIEANRTGPSATIGARPPWPFTFYAIAHAFEATPVPPELVGPLGPVLPPPGAPASSSSSSGPPPAVYFVGGAAALALVYFLWL